MLPRAHWDFNRSNKHCSQESATRTTNASTATEHKFDKTRIENWLPTGSVLGSSRLVTNTTTILSSAATEKSHNISIPIHKILEQPWRHFASLKLWKCFQIPHPSTRASSTFWRWHMFCFDTSYKGGKYFLPILKLLGLTCVIFFFPVYCNLGVLFLIDVRKIICLSSNEILLYLLD